jgi:hypothetical protein
MFKVYTVANIKKNNKEVYGVGIFLNNVISVDTGTYFLNYKTAEEYQNYKNDEILIGGQNESRTCQICEKRN